MTDLVGSLILLGRQNGNAAAVEIPHPRVAALCRAGVYQQSESRARRGRESDLYGTSRGLSLLGARERARSSVRLDTSSFL